VRLSELVPPGCAVTILADRGFATTSCSRSLMIWASATSSGFAATSRHRCLGRDPPAAEWVGKSGRRASCAMPGSRHRKRIRSARWSVSTPRDEEPWCLAASNAEASTAMLVNHYAKRWTIEPSFRDTKDLRFAWAWRTRIGEPTRRDRCSSSMPLQCSAHHARAAGESLGMDRLLKSNTSKTELTRCSDKAACSTNSSNHARASTIPTHGPLRRDRIACRSFSGLFEII